MRSRYFSVRNVKELLRDPLSYIFCLGFPVIMLVIMTFVNSSIPTQAKMTIFQIQNLGPGIAVFSLTFTMLFSSLSVSKDRTNAFLVRLYASPMKGIDFIVGYTMPLLIIAIAQCAITFIASVFISTFTHYNFLFENILLAILVLVPSMILFVGFGILFGTLFGEKSAPALCSILISVAGMLGGIWMDIDLLGGKIAFISKLMPFYYGVKVARMAVFGEYEGIGKPLLVLCIYALIIYSLAVISFRRKMQSDLK